ncbi:MAG: glycoside hydrolase family 2 TIM barrel-domain containing protein, partial [Terrimicrobiaceae bacterium]
LEIDPEFIIENASYGVGDTWADATEALRGKVVDGQLNIPRVWCDLVGDPAPDIGKVLRVTTSIRGREYTCEVPDGLPLEIDPEHLWKAGALRLGIYRNVTAGGTFKVSLPIISGPENIQKDATSEIRGVVEDAKGKTVAKIKGAWEGRQAIWTVNPEALPPGEYKFRGSLKIEGLTVEGTASFSRLAVLPEWKSSIDKHGRLIVDGKPFFPLGMFWWEFKPEYLALFAESPFNCLLPYTSSNPDFEPWSEKELDLVSAKGLKVIWALHNLFGDNKACLVNVGIAGVNTREEERPAMEKMMKRFSSHPAIIAWYVADEPTGKQPERIRDHLQWAREIDPTRPAYTVFMPLPQTPLEYAMPELELFGVDPYPLPNRSALRKLIAELHPSREIADLGGRSALHVPQAFHMGRYGTTPEAKAKQRFPTPDELRSIFWTEIACGANGLMGYALFELVAMDTEMAPAGDKQGAMVREQFAARWQTVCNVAKEIRDRIPMLLSIESFEQPTSTKAPETAAWRGWGFQGKTWLLLVNTDDKSDTAFEFAFAKPVKSATLDLGEAGCLPKGKSFKATVPPLGVALVALEF